MKRFILLILILTFTIATLCGCNRDEKSNNNVESNISESISSENSDEQNNYTDTFKESENNGNKKKIDNVSAGNSVTQEKDSTVTGQHSVTDKSDNNNPVKNSTSSSVSKDEEYEAEIDFSELE